jgi:hypothetical protein
VLRNRGLRRVVLGYTCFSSTELAVWIAMLVYAYQQGGATEAGVVALVQLVPATLFAPVGGVLADRRPGATLAGGYLAQAAAMGGTAAVLLAGGRPIIGYVLAAAVTALVTVTRPAQAALTPSLSRTPDELTGFNVVAGWIRSAALFAVPILTAIVLTFGSPGAVFAVSSAFAAAAWLCVRPLSTGRPVDVSALAEGNAARVWAGFRTVATHGPVRLLVGFLVAQCVVLGAFDVIAVVLALDVLDLGASGAGYLNAALGAGGIAGGAATLALIGRRRLVPPILAGAVILGGAFVLLGAYPTIAGAVVLLAVAGGGATLIDVAGRTLLQRIAPADVLARVFALHEALSQAGFAIGAILVPVFMAAGGAKAALVAAGALLPLLVLIWFRSLRSIDSAATVPVVEISLLRSIPIFASLPAPALESLARSLEPTPVAAGSVVIREGEAGDRYYAIADGEVEITRKGGHLAMRHRGEGLGEIALLRDVPRTATATAVTDGLLYALDRDPFVIAVTGHAPSARAADEVVRQRSERDT